MLLKSKKSSKEYRGLGCIVSIVSGKYSDIGSILELFGDAPSARFVPLAMSKLLLRLSTGHLSIDRRDITVLGLKNHEYGLRRFRTRGSLVSW